jgi:hypothetical protein
VLAVGDRVTAKYRGKGKWFSGKISGVTRDASVAGGVLYDVAYDDGDKDSSLLSEFVRRDGGGGGDGGGSGGAGSTAAERAPSPKKSLLSDVGGGGDSGGGGSSELAVGDRVVAKYRGKGKWFSGKISGVTRDASVAGGVLYDVAYDDGDKDSSLLSEFVKSEGPVLARMGDTDSRARRSVTFASDVKP